MAILNNSNAISTAGGYDINNSLRLRASASAYLNRTPASTTNRRTYTYSFWTKYSTGSSDVSIFSTYGGSAGQFLTIGFIDSGKSLVIDQYNGSARDLIIYTTQVFRDPSAWYHVVIAVDTTQATSSNRVKIYVNGSQVTAFATATYPSLNFDTYVNTTQVSNVGRRVDIPGQYYDGYLAEVNFVDGQALTPSSFGETDTTTGSWKPKAYSGTYGTNGFYLKFSDIATTSGSNAGLGKDFSGNTNYWTTNNISVTAGVTYDAMIDSPTLTSATVANYATLNPLLRLNGIVGTFTNGNLNFLAPTAADYYYCSTMFTGTTGKYYSEATINAIGSGIVNGLINEAQVGTAWGNKAAYRETGVIYDLSGTTVTSGSTFTTGDVIGIAVDIGAGTVQFYKNNVAQGATPSFSFTAGTPLAFAGRSNNGNADLAFNFGQRPFKYTPPSGFVALNTYNLPDSTIKKGNTVMDATLYTQNGTSTNVVTNAGAFKPDLVWLKCRSNAGTYNVLTDTVRGIANSLYSNTSTAENSDGNNFFNSFNSNGFSLTLGDSGTNSTSGRTQVAWQWQSGQGTNTSNTSGSITSTVSVNATAGFSVVTYTGTGANATVGHGLGVAPAMMIVKSRNTTVGQAWRVYHKNANASPASGVLNLNVSDAFVTSSTQWNNTAPTSSVLSIGTDPALNENTKNYVAYCWAEIAGFSKFGSYTGNGSTDGPFVYLGFRPKYVLIKRTDAVASWEVIDTARDPYNASANYLYPNLSDAEVNAPSNTRDYLSNGFKIRHSGGGSNASGGTYIYMAFAENPFKNANAR
jgi:hypothetical protein